MLWLVLGLVILILLAVWVTWTAMRIDRLDARVEGAWQSLDAQLVRRVMALRETVAEREDHNRHGQNVVDQQVRDAAARAVTIEDRALRAAAENDVGAQIAALPADARDERLRAACIQVQTARTFYNDAVRACSALRSQRLPRLLRLGSAAPVPPYFDIDDSPGTGWSGGD